MVLCKIFRHKTARSCEERGNPCMKKLTSMLLALALVLSLAACGGAASSSVASSAASSEAVPEAASEAASSEEAKELSTTDALRIAGLKGPTTMGLVNLLSMEEDGTASMDYDLQLLRRCR